MNSVLKKLIVIYLILVVLKVAFALFVLSPTIYADEYVYSKSARSFFVNKEFSLHGTQSSSYPPPLYLIVISISYIFGDMNSVYLLMKIINSILSSLVIFPIYLLFREFFNSRKSLYGAFLVGIMPFSFLTSSYIMTENLFYVLFFFAIYFIFKISMENNIKHALLAGVSVGLSLLTRDIGLILFLLMGTLFVYFIIKKDYCKLKNFIIASLIGGISYVAWTIRNLLLKTKSVFYLIETITTNETISGNFILALIMFILWIFIHLSYIILSTGILPSFFSVNYKKIVKDEKGEILSIILLTLVFFIIVIISRRAITQGIKAITLIPNFPGRLIGRYVDFTLPLVVLSGFIGLQKNISKEFIKRAVIICLIIITGGFILFYYPLFPFNNTPLTLFGALKLMVEYLFSGGIETAYISVITLVLILAVLYASMFVVYQLIKKVPLNFYRMFWILAIFFIITNVISLGAIYYNSSSWNKDEQFQLGKYLNEMDTSKSKVIIDERYCSNDMKIHMQDVICIGKERPITLVGFWINKDIEVTDIKTAAIGDFIITKDKLNMELIKKTSGKIKLYKKE